MVFLCPIWTYLGLPNDLFAEMHRKSSTLEQVELFPSLYLTCMLQTSKGTYQHTDDENFSMHFFKYKPVQKLKRGSLLRQLAFFNGNCFKVNIAPISSNVCTRKVFKIAC